MPNGLLARKARIVKPWKKMKERGRNYRGCEMRSQNLKRKYVKGDSIYKGNG